MLYNLKFIGGFDKEYFADNPIIPIKEFLKDHIELLQKNDIDMLYHYINEESADCASDLTVVLLACEVDFLKYTNKIPENCFYCCVIQHIDIPWHITYLGKHCFMDTALKEITIPGNVEVIDSYAFFRCESLKKVIIEEGVKIIKEGAFTNCPIEHLKLPNSIEQIADDAFNIMGDVIVPKGSYAEQWCIKNGWEYELEN